MIEAGRKQGRTYSQPDLFIAASALMHGLIVVTRNAGIRERKDDLNEQKEAPSGPYVRRSGGSLLEAD